MTTYYPKDFGLNKCALCNVNSDLKSSHIIPSFVFDWKKKTSGTGHLRCGRNVNMKIQDGLKPKLFCADCEIKFSKVEKVFSEKIFNPVHYNNETEFPYEGWMLKFAVSIS